MPTSEHHVFEKSSRCTLPLTVDRVNGARYITSPFLRRLPIELFHHITQYLNINDLECLSLVDRDCLYLARSVQYTSIRLNPSDISSSELLQELEPSNSNIGFCIRRITVADACFAPKQRGDIFDANTSRPFYLSLSRVIQTSLPNLHILNWDASTTISRDIISGIAASSIKHLRLNRVHVDCEFTVPIPGGAQNWALETLEINVTWDTRDGSFGSTLPFISSALFQAEPTLRHLAWKGDRNSLQHYGDIFSIRYQNMPRFQNLRCLILDAVYDMDTSVLSAFLGEHTRLHSLSVDLSMKDDSEFLRSRGCIPSLESFNWINHISSGIDEIISFVRNNPQLQGFGVMYPLPTSALDLCLLPAICLHLDNLTSLNLIWEDEVVPRDSLRAIGIVKSLEHIWISAGSQGLHEWEINHDTILDELKLLFLLKTISFSRDSYRLEGHPLRDPSVHGYFKVRTLPVGVQPRDYLTETEIQYFNRELPDFDAALALRDEMMMIAWERWHRSRMIKIGTRYAQEFPCLKWCFIGQLQIEISDSSERTVTLSHEARDPSAESVKEKWGISCNI